MAKLLLVLGLLALAVEATLALDDACSDCVKSFADLEQKFFGPGGVEDQMRQQLEPVCDSWPSFLKKQCKSGIDDAVKLMFVGVREQVDNPEKQCKNNGACSNKLLTATGLELPSCCNTCRNLTARIVGALKNPKLHSRLDTLASLPCYFRVDKHKCEVPRVARVEALLNNLTQTVKNFKVCDACCRHNVMEVEQVKVERNVSANVMQCALCKLVGNVINTALQNGMSMDMVEEQAIQMCNAMPGPLKTRCLENMKQFTQMVDALKLNGGNVPAACVVVDQCNPEAKAEIEQVGALENPLDCVNCKLIANIIRQALLAGRTKDQIMSDCLAFCAKLVPRTVADTCTNLIQNQLDQFIDIVNKNNGNAKLACKEFGKCKKSAQQEPALPMLEADSCEFCEQQAEILSARMDSGDTKDMILNEWMDVCNTLDGDANTFCMATLSKQIAPLIDALDANEQIPKRACVAVGRCAASKKAIEAKAEKFSNPVSCVACNIVSELVEQLLIQGEDKADIDLNVQDLCIRIKFKPLARECINLLAKTNQIITALGVSHGDAEAACQFMNKCANKDV